MSSKQIKRRRKVLRALRSSGVFALLTGAALVAAACDGESPAGYKAPGSAQGGTAGSNAAVAAGDTSSPSDAGADTGGMGDTGGSGGSKAGSSSSGGSGGSSGSGISLGGRGGAGGAGGKGGSGGSGGAGTVCGNGKVEGTEECDDGNTANFDGCSSQCQSKCESCLHEFYGEDPDYQYLVDFCQNSISPAENGPAAGQLRSKLCQGVVKCMVDSGCATGAAQEKSTLLDICYCGAGVSEEECLNGGADHLGNPQGPCVKEMNAAAEDKNPSTVEINLTNLTLGLGVAELLMVRQADTGYCVEVCGLGRPLDDCTPCAAGDVHTFDITATCPTCFNTGSCSFALSDCVRAHCTAADVQSCYAHDGPCAAQIAAVGYQYADCYREHCPGPSDPRSPCLAVDGPCSAEIAAAGPGFRPVYGIPIPTPLQTTEIDLSCRADACPVQCFKPAGL
jgi:cysteine-rich repeat protein